METNPMSSYRMFVTTITSTSDSVLNLEIGIEGRTLGDVISDVAFQWRANTDEQMYNITPITRFVLAYSCADGSECLNHFYYYPKLSS